MKKKISLILVFMLVLMTAGCGGSSGTNDAEETQEITEEEIAEDTSEETEGTEESDESEEAEESQETQASEGSISIEPQEIYNDGSIIITADELTFDDASLEISLTAQNSSADDYTIQIQEGSTVNGYSEELTYIQSVSAGSTETAWMFCLTEELGYAGIDTISELKFKLEFENDDSEEEFESDLITLQTSAYGYEQTYDDSGDVLYDAEGIRIVYQDYIAPDGLNGTSYVLLYAENNTEQDIRIGEESVSVNRYMADSGYISPDVICAGDKAIVKLCILNDDLEEIGITQIEEVEEITVDFIVYGAFDYSDVINEIGSITIEI